MAGTAGSARVLVVQHEDGTGPGLVGEHLERTGLHLHTVHPWAGEALPARLDGYAGLLVLGGAPNCEDDAAAPWLPRVRELIRQAVADHVPLLGICLGGQLMAVALGGSVAPRGRMPEVGATPLRRLPAADRDAVFGGVPEGALAAQWHWDEITALPPDAVALLGGDDSRHQAFRVGACGWGVQFHPEVLAAVTADWAGSDGPAVKAAGGDPQAAVDSVRAAEPELRAVWGAMAEAWGEVVRRA
ncbi:type 1 glutamine amidotransferase [Kitasatospora terrestris]|uniref:Type 1 glutamine amidotransferase n=1 Tax=Kitasatospora terrestris TaxID=258051 RepID=A0ABP9ERZ0_9ACTN